MNNNKLMDELYDLKSSLLKISEKIPENLGQKNAISTHSELIQYTKKYIDSRQMRQNMIHPQIFSNPSWDILIELFYAKLINRVEYVSSISTAGGTPPTTGLRHICVLEDIGFVVRESHPNDRRRVNLRITDSAYEMIRDFFIRTSQS